MKDHVKLDEDKILLLRAGQKDERIAFGQIYRKYYPTILSYLCRYENNLALREELAQECFLRAWQNRRNFEATSSVKTYLIGIAKKVANERIKKSYSERKNLRLHRNPDLKGTSFRTSSPPLTFQNCGFEETQEALACALELLAPQARKAIELYFFQGLRGSAAAQKCECSRATFNRCLDQAKIRLRELLQRKI